LNVQLTGTYRPSRDVVARKIEGEIILVPLAAGMGDLEDELYTLNPTGAAVWRMLDGRRTLRAVAAALAKEYRAAPATVRRDVLGLVAELARRRMVVAVPR
jgi:hypothetical protein